MNEVDIAGIKKRSRATRGLASAPVMVALLLCAAVFAAEPENVRAHLGAPKRSSGATILPPSATDPGTSFGRLPLSFAPNEGQTAGEVRFLARGNGYSLFLTDAAAVLALTQSPPPKTAAALRPTDATATSPRHTTAVMRMELVGGRGDVRVAGVDQLPGVANYFIGNDPSAWHRSIPTFARVRYTGVYPGIDLIYYGNERQLEYDFVVAPGGDPAHVRLRFAGAQEVRLKPSGDLTVTADGAKVIFHSPVTYQLRAGRRKNVHSAFRLLANNTVGFALGNYDHGRALVIDPTLGYSTYLGGGGNAIPAGPNCCGDYGNGIAVDQDGNAYVTGETGSSNFPVTKSAYQSKNNNSNMNSPGNVFVTKLNATGTAVIYSTYLGGTGDYWYGDTGLAIAVDSEGNAYVAGSTGSQNFPTTANAFLKVNKPAELTDSQTAFVTELNSTGTELVYSTYLGGSGIPGYPYGYPPGDVAQGLALGPAGTVFVVGTTYSSNFPVTGSAVQKANNASAIGQSNLFVTQLNTSGSGLVYSTYLGGKGYSEGCCYYFNGGDYATGIAVDGAGSAYVTGYAYSQDFPVTPGAYQLKNLANKSINGTGAANYNAIVTKFDPTGSTLLYSTYLGGNGNVFFGDQSTGIAVDSACYAYVAGRAGSADFPVTKGAFQTTNKDPSIYFSGFVTKLNPQGSGLVYSSYLGGSGGNGTFGPGDAVGDTVNGIRVDAEGHAFVTGKTQSADFPVTSNAFQSKNNQTSNPGANYYSGNAFVTEFSPSGATLVYSSFFGGSGGPGGSGGDAAAGVALDPAGNAYLTGHTLSQNFPVSTGAFQATSPAYAAGHDSSGNAFVAKFSIGSGATIRSTTTSVTASANPAAAGANLTFTASVAQPTVCGFPPTGSVSFVIDGGAPIVVALNHSAQAIYETSSLRVGAHTIVVSYSGDAQDAKSESSLSESVISASTVTISPTSLTFPSTAAGSSSIAQVVTVKNPGSTTVTISSITLTGGQADDYILTKTCGSSIAAGASCTLSVTFKPVSAGTKLANISIADSASGSPQSVALTGTGTAAGAAPVVKLSATSLTFSSQAPGTSSAAQTVTLTNRGTASLSLSSITLTGGQADDYVLSKTCGASLAAGASCSLSVTFKPVSAGTKLASITTIADNASGSPQSVALTGTGTASAPGVKLSATSLTFASQAPGTSSAAQTVTLTNSGTAALTLTSIKLTGGQADDYVLSKTCGASLAAGASCALSVTFKPVSAGTKLASISIADNASGSPQGVALLGTGS